ncbi:hypothetical protein [uncultured Methanobrevibacter sp.]|uniref:hypothetical protein n=1 Tax=uncultured Methanobrevibacter sp. TaxID=253161 RepID=UPI0025E63A79|nr:hypothetical protein [uncultured Methanobrevibacter sp.]
MKSSLFTILIITISIALFSVCAVSASYTDNIDLGDSDFDSELLVENNTIQSNPQELENKSVDTGNDDNHTQNMKDYPDSNDDFEIKTNETHNFNKNMSERNLDKILKKDPNFEPDSRHKDISKERHESLNKTTLTKIRDILKTLSPDDYKEMHPPDNLTAYNSWEEMYAALSQQSSSNQ